VPTRAIPDEICPGRDLERVTSIDGRFGVSAAASSAITAVTPAATF
jgi:hypothetical protein